MIGIEDVFEARIASGRSSSSARRKTSSLTAASSTTASIIRSAATRSLGGLHAGEHLVGIGAALLGQSVQALAHPLEARLDRARDGVVQRDAPSGGGDDLRDAAAHLAGADDEDVPRLAGLWRRRLTGGGEVQVVSIPYGRSNDWRPGRACIRVDPAMVDSARLRALPLFEGLAHDEVEVVASMAERADRRRSRPAQTASATRYTLIEEGDAVVVQDGKQVAALGPATCSASPLERS